MPNRAGLEDFVQGGVGSHFPELEISEIGRGIEELHTEQVRVSGKIVAQPPSVSAIPEALSACSMECEKAIVSCNIFFTLPKDRDMPESAML